MSLDLDQLKKLHDKAYLANQVTRERAADDIVFYWVTQWDDQILSDSQLAYRGEFNIIRKAGRQILSDLASNPVQVDFVPEDQNREDSAELLDGIYRSEDRKNTSQDAYQVAQQDAVVCGYGAWVLSHEYVSNRTGDESQVIKRKPIHEANNVCFFDPNARLLDKSDADYASILTPYTPDGYNKLIEGLGVDAELFNPSNFSSPEQSYSFPWLGGGGNDVVYIVEFYHREKVKEKIITFEDPIGEVIVLREKDLETVMDDMLDGGFEIVSEKTVERYQVTKYIASGSDILDESIIAGENIPVVPYYGERAYVEGEEHYEGVTRLAKDPQRLRNFQMSYLADIVSRSPRPKPIFFPEQIQSFEYMYEQAGADNNYPYVLQNRLSKDGSALPIGAVAQLPEQPMPTALIASVELSRQAVEDVANPGIPQDIADPDLSGKAVNALTARLDKQSQVYQENGKHAKRRDAEIFASMATEIYDVPKMVKITLPDGTTKDVQIMEQVIDQESGDVVILNDLTNQEFQVYSKIGASYSSQKEQTIERIGRMLQTPTLQPKYAESLMLKLLQLTDGVEFDDIRDMAKMDQVLNGFRKPETPEEEQALLAMQQQPQQPSAEMVLAQGELMKGQAQMADVQNKSIKTQLEAQNEKMKRIIDMFEAQTDRIDSQVKATETQTDIDYKRVDTVGAQLDNAAKMKELATVDYSQVSNEELFQQMAG